MVGLATLWRLLPGRRFIFSNGKLERRDPPAGRLWNFPSPFGEQAVTPLLLSETITISRHLQTQEIRVFLNVAPIEELRNPNTPVPAPADETGRSAQTFVMDVIARRDNEERRITATGRDIYAVTAPIVVEGMERIVRGSAMRTGVVVAGEAFDARDFLNSLSPAFLTVDFCDEPSQCATLSSSPIARSAIEPDRD
jgi:hypothetical protein